MERLEQMGFCVPRYRGAKMSYDYRADENGEFEIEFSNYETGEIIGHVFISGLKPYLRISRDILKDGER